MPAVREPTVASVAAPAVAVSASDITAACALIVPFLKFVQTNNTTNPAFIGTLISAFDGTDVNQAAALAALLSLGPVSSLTNVLALLGPAVQFALTMLQDKQSRTPANIERFVVTLVLALAQTINRLANSTVIPLDDDMVQGVTVTARNILDVYQQDYGDINIGQQISFAARLFGLYGGACMGCCKKQ